MMRAYRLLSAGAQLFVSLANRKCGNAEGTPCDDMQPGYVCAYHKWIKDSKKLLATRKIKINDEVVLSTLDKVQQLIVHVRNEDEGLESLRKKIEDWQKSLQQVKQ